MLYGTLFDFIGGLAYSPDSVNSAFAARRVLFLPGRRFIPSLDDLSLVEHSFYSSTPAVFFTTTDTLTATTETLEETYHLEGYSWALGLINSNTNSIEFLANGKNVTLELSKSNLPPKAPTDIECAQSAGATGADAERGGVCVYLTRCAAAKDIGLDEFRNTYCIVDNKYAGVCCPRNKVDTTTP